MTADSFDSVFLPILRDLQGHLGDLVVIGGWVPELHRRFGDSEDWEVIPLRTTEVDILINDPERHFAALADALLKCGFSPVGQADASAIWERDTSVGERIEFFVNHTGPWASLSTVRAFEPGSRIGGLLLRNLDVLQDHSVELRIPVRDAAGSVTPAVVRVPELGAFLIHKGATFRERNDRAKRVKDLHYIVDVMQSGAARIDDVEKQISSYCEAGGRAAELARKARDHTAVFVAESSTSVLRQQLADGLSLRHAITPQEGDARARGFLSDFIGLIPEDCGGL